MTQNNVTAAPALGAKLSIQDGNLVAAVDLVPGDLLFIDKETPFTRNRLNIVQKFLAIPEQTRSIYHDNEHESENLEPIRNAVGVENNDFTWKPGHQPDEMTKEDAMRVVDTLDRLSIPVTNPVKGKLGYALFYPLLYLRTHSCHPSTVVVPAAAIRDMGEFDALPIALVATLAVPAGTILTHSRIPWHLPRPERQLYVQQVYDIICRCSRCANDGTCRAADRNLLGTVRGFSAEDDPEDAARIIKMRNDYNKIEVLVQQADTSTQVPIVTDQVIEFLNEHTFLHIGHWRLWKLFNLLFMLQIRLGQYVLVMKTLSAMMRNMAATARDYPAIEWAAIAYKYKYVTYILKKSVQQTEQNLHDNGSKTVAPELYEERLRILYEEIDQLFDPCRKEFVKTFNVFRMFKNAINENTEDVVEVVSG